MNHLLYKLSLRSGIGCNIQLQTVKCKVKIIEDFLYSSLEPKIQHAERKRRLRR